MATYIVEKFLEQEKTSFKVFTEPVAARILEAAFRAISETLRIGLTKKDSTSVTVPWGKFTAERRVRNSGDSANTNISYEPTKAFLEALNSDGKDSGSYYQEDYDEQFSTAFVDYTAYGFFNPDADENKSKLATAKKCLRLDETDRDYFLNRIAALLVSIGKEKQRRHRDRINFPGISIFQHNICISPSENFV